MWRFEKAYYPVSRLGLLILAAPLPVVLYQWTKFGFYIPPAGIGRH